jgi:hypothetical protein
LPKPTPASQRIPAATWITFKENGGTSYLILSHVPFSELGLPTLPETPVNAVSEKVMEMTIPFALGWGAVLTAVTVGVAAYDKKKKEKATADEKAETQK